MLLTNLTSHHIPETVNGQKKNLNTQLWHKVVCKSM